MPWPALVDKNVTLGIGAHRAAIRTLSTHIERLSICCTFEKLTNPADDQGAIVWLSQALPGPIRFGTFDCTMLLAWVNQHLGIIKSELRMTLEAHCTPVGIAKCGIWTQIVRCKDPRPGRRSSHLIMVSNRKDEAATPIAHPPLVRSDRVLLEATHPTPEWI